MIKWVERLIADIRETCSDSVAVMFWKMWLYDNEHVISQLSEDARRQMVRPDRG